MLEAGRWGEARITHILPLCEQKSPGVGKEAELPTGVAVYCWYHPLGKVTAPVSTDTVHMPSNPVISEINVHVHSPKDVHENVYVSPVPNGLQTVPLQQDGYTHCLSSQDGNLHNNENEWFTAPHNNRDESCKGKVE